jgi:hypothetical protein
VQKVTKATVEIRLEKPYVLETFVGVPIEEVFSCGFDERKPYSPDPVSALDTNIVKERAYSPVIFSRNGLI